MQLVHHLNYYDTDGCVYCERLEQVAEAAPSDSDHIERHCAHCPYFAGTLQQGEGIECLYGDSTVKPGETLVVVDSPWEQQEKRRKAHPIEGNLRHRAFVVKG